MTLIMQLSNSQKILLEAQLRMLIRLTSGPYYDKHTLDLPLTPGIPKWKFI